MSSDSGDAGCLGTLLGLVLAWIGPSAGILGGAVGSAYLVMSMDLKSLPPLLVFAVILGGMWIGGAVAAGLVMAILKALGTDIDKC